MPINPCRNPSCEYFNKSLPSNAKVCPMCGKPLGNVLPAPEASPGIPPQPPVVPPPPKPTPAQPSPSPIASPYYPEYQAPPQSQPAPPQPVSRPSIRLIHPSGREFYLKGDEGYIGRRGQNSTTVPDVDLTGLPHEGVVSRSHARLYWDAVQNSYMIMDNSSRNGTFLNGSLLRPGMPYRLGHGVLLQLGQEGLVYFTVAIA
ncbi:FHA domain-containing protein [Oculatella sp. LEGE 06141]|uniref:FHA domain-containing protein n=1 Tax=Oculatella sp. LEGE 06141 TaxID=1828648 RepID=UPI00187FC2CD|nr:FHA domain-containing protein [Oculatella sp. LEGE 06141]MBE9181993.1 FHA domain-containing protein [Oculatella sp. LEGE 06141]